MTRKLGETLVEAGVITEAQLHRALTAQLVFGGHLGTSLLELGYLDEETLGETLAGMFGVAYADFDMLSKVPYAVVRCLPARLVEKHKVIPLRLEGRTLHLAMIDPKNLLALDEISFVCGYRLVPWVSPEVRIVQVLDKYYNLPRSQRFITLARELSRLRSRREKLRPLHTDEMSIAAGGRASAAARGGAADPGPDDAAAGAAGLALAAAVATGRAGDRGAAASPRASLTAGAGGEPPADPWERYGYGRSWREVAEAIEAEPAPVEADGEEVDTRPQPTARAAGMPAPAARVAPSLAEVSRKLAEACSVEEVVTTALDYVDGRLRRGIVFVVKGDRAIGWAGRGDGLSESLVRSLALPHLKESSILSLAADGRSHYLGAPPPTTAVGEFYAQLGVTMPRTVLIVPIVVKGRVTAWLYADGGDQEILAIDLPAVLSLCLRAGLALQVTILRNKILAG